MAEIGNERLESFFADETYLTLFPLTCKCA